MHVCSNTVQWQSVCVCVCVSVCVCYHLCKTPTSLLVVCDKLFGSHSAAERAVPVQITRRQASGRIHWPGHTDIRTEGWCKPWPHFSQTKTTSPQAQKTDCTLLSFPFAVLFSRPRRAGKFWRVVGVLRAITAEDTVIRRRGCNSFFCAAVVRCLWTSADTYSQLSRPFLAVLGPFGRHSLRQGRTQTYTHAHTYTHTHTHTHTLFDPGVSPSVSSKAAQLSHCWLWMM